MAKPMNSVLSLSLCIDHPRSEDSKTAIGTLQPERLYSSTSPTEPYVFK